MELDSAGEGLSWGVSAYMNHGVEGFPVSCWAWGELIIYVVRTQQLLPRLFSSF